MTVFEDAWDLIVKRGWWRGPAEVAGNGRDRGIDGCLCIATAVLDAGGTPGDLAELKRRLGIPLEEGSLAIWNDEPARTLGDVRRALTGLGPEAPAEHRHHQHRHDRQHRGGR